MPPGHSLVLSGADQHRLRPRPAPVGGVHPGRRQRQGTTSPLSAGRR